MAIQTGVRAVLGPILRTHKVAHCPPPTNQSVEDSLCECSLCDTPSTTSPVPMIDSTPVELSANRFPLEPEFGSHTAFDAMTVSADGWSPSIRKDVLVARLRFVAGTHKALAIWLRSFLLLTVGQLAELGGPVGYGHRGN